MRNNKVKKITKGKKEKRTAVGGVAVPRVLPEADPFKLDQKLEEQCMPKREGFKIHCKQLMLTWPNLPSSWDINTKAKLQLVVDKAVGVFGPMEKWGIALEHHTDKAGVKGAPHIHMVCQLPDNSKTKSKGWYLSGSKGLDLLDSLMDIPGGQGPKHGHYTGCRNFMRSVKYITKEGNFLLKGIDLSALTKSLDNKSSYGWNEVANLITGGSTLEELNGVCGGMIAQHLVKLQHYKLFVDSSVRVPNLLPWEGVRVPGINDETFLICSWLNENINRPRAHKQKQLFICGKTNTGKTHLWMKLAEYVPVYVVPYEQSSNFMSGYSDKYGLVVFDEFVGQKEVNFMNGFVEGSPYQVLKKGMAEYTKMKNVPVIVCSNKRIADLYPQVKEKHEWLHEAFCQRFTEVVVNKRMDVQFKKAPSFELDDGKEDKSEEQLMQEQEQRDEESRESEEFVFPPPCKHPKHVLDEVQELLRSDEEFNPEEYNKQLQGGKDIVEKMYDSSEEEEEEDEDDPEDEDEEGKEDEEPELTPTELLLPETPATPPVSDYEVGVEDLEDYLPPVEVNYKKRKPNPLYMAPEQIREQIQDDGTFITARELLELRQLREKRPRNRGPRPLKVVPKNNEKN